MARWQTVLGAVLGAAALTGGGAAPAHANTSVPCSTSALVAAVAATYPNNGGTLDLAAGCTYRLLTAAYTPADPNRPSAGLPRIYTNVTINGNGATITRADAAPPFRIFDVSGGSLTVKDLTVTNGLLVDPVLPLPGGGVAIGSVQYGAAIAATSASLSISNSTFARNRAPGGGAVAAAFSGSHLAIDHSRFFDNAAEFDGGAVQCCGGGLNAPTSTITASTFAHNAAGLQGGAIETSATNALITGSTFVANAAGSDIPGVDLTSGPGVTLAPTGGGAIADLSAGTTTVADSTFVDNVATGQGGAILGQTLPETGSTFTVTTSTIAHNRALIGGGIALWNGNHLGHGLRLQASIASDNAAAQNPNCSGITDDGYNLDSGTSCGFTAATHGLSNADARLQPLADNGGPTKTMALGAGSAALDQIPSTLSVCLGTTDQRGVARPKGIACDLGAFEAVP